jgi:hypothetical protein
MREAADYIQTHGPPGARVFPFTGVNNLSYYYPSDLIGTTETVVGLCDFDWLVSLPKLTFGSAEAHPIVRWVREHEPDLILREGQIETARLYRLGQYCGEAP